MLRLPLLLVGAALLVASARIPVEAVGDGGRTLEGFWVAALGVAVAALGIGWVRGWRRAALLAAGLALVTAAQLTVTRPAWLQFVELRFWRLGEDPLLVAAWGVIALQVLAVARFAARHRARIADALAPFRRWRVALPGAALFLLSAVHLTRAFDLETRALDVGSVLRVGLQLAVTAVLFAANVLHVVALAAALPLDDLRAARRRLLPAVALPGSTLPPTGLDRALPFLLALFATGSSALLCAVVLDRVPHVPDGVPYLFQARCLAAGLASVPAPPVPEAFEVYLVEVTGGRMFGVTNPGWPAVLAIGSLLGAEWLVNPVLGGLGVLLVHGLVRRIADTGTAHAIAVLLAASPWFLWISASFMTHALTLALLAGGWLALRSGSTRSSLVAGLCMGLVCLVRPLDGIAAGTLTGLWALGLGGARLPWRNVLVYATGCVLGALPLLFHNAALTGDPLGFAINAYLDRVWYPGANALGFGPQVGNPTGWGPLDQLSGHGAWDVVYNANQNLYNLNFELLGWCTGSLAPIACHLLLGRWNRLDRAAIAFVAVLGALYSCYWFSGGSDYGPRYWYPMILPALWLAYRGLGTLGAVLEPRFEGAPLRVAATAGMLVALALAVFVPWRAIAKYPDYRGYHGDFRRLADRPAVRGALVLVDVADESEYGLAFLQNAPRIGDGETVFAWARDPETVRRLREAFPDRPAVRVSGRSVDGETRITGREPPLSARGR